MRINKWWRFDKLLPVVSAMDDVEVVGCRYTARKRLDTDKTREPARNNLRGNYDARRARLHVCGRRGRPAEDQQHGETIKATVAWYKSHVEE